MSSLLDRKNWWKVMLALSIFSGIGLLFMTVQTYKDAPPKVKFVTNTGKTVFTVGSLEHGQSVFMKYALMDHGSIFGDGGYRGQDYTAECLHETALLMNKYYHDRLPESDNKVLIETAKLGVEERVRFEIKQNLYNPEKNEVILTEGQVYAYWEMVKYYSLKFKGKGKEPFTPANFISDENEIKNLTAFFFWSSWACGALRPGEDASYTQNWPYDEVAGNNVSFPAVFWSIIGCFSLIFALGLVFYFFGKFQSQTTFKPSKDDIATEDSANQFVPTPTQKATYKFFAIAIFLFFVQVLSGILTIHDFVGFTEFNGYEITEDLPLNITRSWHTQMAILWIATCWIAASIFILPIISPKEPPLQLLLINILFWALFIVVVGSLVGIFVGPKGWAGEYWRWLGHQGWEFLEMGRLWQYGLALGFFIWLVIIYRGVKSSLGSIKALALPHWILYAVMGIVVMFGFSFVAGPDENFVIADFWRWLVLHMFVECFFETFTTVIIAYFMTIMGLVNKEDANRVVYFAVLLFLGSGFLGVSHNFYWNGKPEATLAIGSVFSTMQIVPLILLTVQAWRFRRLPVDAMKKKGIINTEISNFGFQEAFLFLIGVNFWNFLGAGVFGFIINLPIINYFEHGTYLTMNHGHAALMGVYGNLSIGGVLFCSRFLLKPGVWNKTLIRTVFWSLNIGLFLMVILNLFPVGLYQIAAVINEGLWYARSNEFIQTQPFQMLTWMRIVGGSIFVVGGVIPLVWFMLTRFLGLKPAVATLNTRKRGMNPDSMDALGNPALEEPGYNSRKDKGTRIFLK